MAREQLSQKSLLILATAGVTLAGTIAFLLLAPEKKLLTAMSLIYPENDTELSAELIVSLLVNSKLNPTSNLSGPVVEPNLPEGHLEPPDSLSLGFGSSKFLLDSRWATIRYLGEDPAGAGLTGKLLNDAQIAALGRINDTIPVVTITQTINEMMEKYFAPLLKTLPRGDEILSRIKVQGAYFSPEYNLANPSQTERDNAYVVGLQSLYVYPNSCFDRTQANFCNPKGFSAGHDPSVIAHELGHVIFNHIRDGQSLEGWQWFAVNEGYADYFSAAHSGNPVLGRVWRASRTSGTKYLRRLLDSPTLNDPSVAQEGHTFSLVWSSALWKARGLITDQFKAKPEEFDRVVLFSINFLGESTKTRLGDAAAAVLKSADILGYSAWKDSLRQEFEAAEINLSRGSVLSPASGQPLKKSPTVNSCGVLSNEPQSNQKGFATLLFALPLFAGFFNRRIKKILSFMLLCSFTQINQGCMLFSTNTDSAATNHKKSMLYNCDLRVLKDGTPVTQSPRKLSFVFKSTADNSGKAASEQIFIGDERFENAESTLLLIVDKEKMRVDQIRRRDGSLFQLNLNQKYVSSEEAVAIQNARLSAIIIEGAGRAILSQNSSGSLGEDSPLISAMAFDYTGLSLSAISDRQLIGPNSFSPVAREVYIDKKLLCKLENVVN